MDFFTVIFVIAFVLLPLLQKILQKPEDEQEQREQRAEPLEPEAKTREPGSWSVDWGDWPGEPPAAEEELVETLPEEAFSHEMRVPEAVRVASPVVSMEPLHVDHSVDYQLPDPRMARKRTARPRPPKQSAYARALRDPKGLRNALVLSEILGPPVGLKPYDG